MRCLLTLEMASLLIPNLFLSLGHSLQTSYPGEKVHFVQIARGAFLIEITKLSTFPPAAVAAATPSNTGEAIRRSATNIPGYGQPDVFYPLSWKGTWNVKREVITQEDTNPVVFTYKIRFLQSIEDDAVVADRGFNQINLERSQWGSDGGGGIASLNWSETNPNDLRMVMPNGHQKEIKVTKRSTERTATTVSSSEFERVSEEDARGIPHITARRVIAKWTAVGDNSLEAIELVYEMGGGGDPLSMSTTAPSQSPKIISKSRLHLTRLE